MHNLRHLKSLVSCSIAQYAIQKYGHVCIRQFRFEAHIDSYPVYREYVCNRLYICIFWKYRELSLVLMQALGTRTEVHGSINFVANDGLGMGGGALYVTSMAQLQLFQGANLTFEGNTGV